MENRQRTGGIGNHRQDEKKTPNPTRERQGKRDAEAGEVGVGAVPEGGRNRVIWGGIKSLVLISYG